MRLAADGRDLSTQEDPACSEVDKPMRCVIKVRRGGVEVSLNGRTVADYRGALDGLRAPREHATDDPKALGIGAWYLVRAAFTKVEVTEVSGPGRVGRNLK
jgi:hypothetical protein